MTKIGFILGTRPEIIKLYSCIKWCQQNSVEYFVINTDQHYDADMRDIFFQELGLEKPKHGLNVKPGSAVTMVAEMMTGIEAILTEEQPSVVVVQGDTNTVLAGGLVATKMGIKLAHVEAGLRSYDRSMPEEYNRIVVDHCADYLFAPTQKQKDILVAEAIEPATVYVTGNTIVDAVEAIVAIGAPSKEAHDTKPFVLLTCHRPSNTDAPENMHAILSAVQEVCEAQDYHAIFPVHPRLNSQKEAFAAFDRIILQPPVAYSQLITYINDAEFIFTDSGGIQEEACILQKKCVILRTNTERPETVEVGGAVTLDSITKEDIIAKYGQLKDRTVSWRNPFGDGKAAERIISVLTEIQ